MKNKKMHIIISMVIICIIVFVVVIMINAKNKNVLYDKNGYFRGIKWGCNYNELSLQVKDKTGKHLDKDGSNGVEYIENFDNIDGVICEAEYHCSGNTYNQIILTIKDKGNYNYSELFHIFLSKLSNMYGEYIYYEDELWWTKDKEDHYEWILNKSTINLYGVENYKSGYICINFADAN